MTGRPRSASKPSATPPPDPRQQLRDFKRFLEGHDPAALAALVADIPGTLASVARINLWFRHYADALKKRRVQ